jgi:hypothetical protein
VRPMFGVFLLLALLASCDGGDDGADQPVGHRGKRVDDVVRLTIEPVLVRPRHHLGVQEVFTNTSAEVVWVGHCAATALDRHGRHIYRVAPRSLGHTWLDANEGGGVPLGHGWMGWRAPSRVLRQALRTVRSFKTRCHAYRWIGRIPESS